MKTSRAFLLFLSMAGAACAGSTETPARGPAARSSGGEAARTAVPGPTLPSTRVAWVPPGTFGPYLGTKPDRTVAVWAAEREGKRHWFSLALGKHGAPLGDPREVANAAAEVDLVAVRPTGGSDSGFSLLATSREFSGERLDVIGLGARGELLGGPSTLSQSQSDIVWIDSVPTAHGALALWAVRRDDRADLYGVPMGVAGDPRERPAVLVPDARAWQISAVTNGVAIAVLTAGKERGQRGPLCMFFSDEEGHVDKKLVLTDGKTVEPDVDLARIGDRLVVAWSDQNGADPRITGMTVDALGNVVQGSTPLVPPFGPQALLRLVPPFDESGPLYVAWENLLEKERGKRVFRVGALSRELQLSQATARVTSSSDTVLPEFSASKGGLDVLTIGAVCPRGASCDDTATGPTFVALDPSMRVVASEPILLPGGAANSADLAWGLDCTAESCDALVAGSGAPTPIYSVQLEPVAGRYESVARRSTDLPTPRVETVEATAKTERVADLSAGHVGNSDFLAWVTDFDPATPFVKTKSAAPDGKYEAVRALVRVQVLSPDHQAPTVLSYRAHSLGGVVLSPGDAARSEALLAWTGIDNRLPQVFLTVLGPGGKKTAQKMLTHGKADVSDVSAVFTGDGWVIGWSDERSGVAQAYVAKVDRKLQPVVRERLVSSSAAAQTGVQLLARGDHIFAVWSQAVPSSPASSDVFAVRLSAKDLGRVGPEHAVAATPANSRTPRLDAFGEGAVVAWVEEPAQASVGIPATIMVARLDSGAEVVTGETHPVRFDGSPTGIALSCEPGSCKMMAVVATNEGGALDGFEWKPGGSPEPVRLLSLEGRPRAATSPVFIGKDLLYADDRAAGDARVRRVSIAWK